MAGSGRPSGHGAAVDRAGAAAEITQHAAQLGSQRALKQAASCYGQDGTLIRASYFFTKAKSSPVPAGKIVRIDLERLPSMIRIAPGHPLRLLLASQAADDFRQYGPTVQLPNPLAPTPAQLSNLVGGL